MRIKTMPAPVQLSDSDKKLQYRYEIEFIFGTSEARIIDLRKNLYQDLQLDEPATEENYLREFEHICAAMLEAAVASDNDRVLCTTFPEGARRIEDAKYLSGIFGQGVKSN